MSATTVLRRPELQLDRTSRRRRAHIVGRDSATNRLLQVAFWSWGLDAEIVEPTDLTARRGDLVLNRIDVSPSLDGPAADFWALGSLAAKGVELLNSPAALLSAHDKLTTALILGRARVHQPRTAHVSSAAAPGGFAPPYVVKPRFGSWGVDVYRCDSVAELEATLEELSSRPWFRLQGALVQELLLPVGRDLRVVVAGGRVVGCVERAALPGEWRTNVALGAVRRPASADAEASSLALAAVAAVGLDLAGVDLMRDWHGRQTVLEINGAVDFTTDYGEGVFDDAVEALLTLAPARSRIGRGADSVERVASYN